MRILIIGGTDFIGPFVAQQLHDQGHELLLYHRGQRTPELPPAIGHLHGDWSQLPAQRDAIRRLGTRQPARHGRSGAIRLRRRGSRPRRHRRVR